MDADVNLGNDDGVDASVTIGGDNDGGDDASADANVGGGDGADASADVNIGGDDGADANVSIGGSGGRTLMSTPAVRMVALTPTLASVRAVMAQASAAAEAMMARPDRPQPPGGTASGAGTVTGAAGSECIGQNDELFAQLAAVDYSGAAVSQWSNATQAAFILVSLCSGMDDQLGSGLLVQATQSVPALQAALDQSQYDATDIVAVVKSGESLNVYVD